MAKTKIAANTKLVLNDTIERLLRSAGLHEHYLTFSFADQIDASADGLVAPLRLLDSSGKLVFQVDTDFSINWNEFADGNVFGVDSSGNIASAGIDCADISCTSLGATGSYPNGTGYGIYAQNGIRSVTYFESTAFGNSDAFRALNNGAKWHFGAGSNDYCTSDGTNVIFACAVSSKKHITPTGGADDSSGKSNAMVAGVTTINTTSVTANSIIQLTHAGTGSVANYGTLYVGTITAGTSFQIKSTNSLDTDQVFWTIIN